MTYMSYMYLLIRHILLFGPWDLCSHVHLSQSSEKTPLFLFHLATADSADVISPVRMWVCLFIFCSELQIKESLDRESKNKALLYNQNIILKKKMCPKMIYDAKTMENVIFVILQFNKHFSEMFYFVPNLVHLYWDRLWFWSAICIKQQVKSKQMSFQYRLQTSHFKDTWHPFESIQRLRLTFKEGRQLFYRL